MVLLSSLALLAGVSTIIAQLPVALDGPARVAWLSLAQRKYGALYAPLCWLGWFQLHRSPAFSALLGLLGLNTLACTIARLRSLTHGIRRQRWASLGTLLTHLAVVSLLLSWTLSSAYTRAVAQVTLASGDVYPLPSRRDLLLRSEALHIQLDAQGGPMDYVADVAVLSGSDVIRTGRLRLGAPLRVAGVGVWLLSYGPGVRVDAEDENGQPLPVETSAGGGSDSRTAANGLAVSLGHGPAVVTIPAAGLELHITTGAPLGEEPSFHLQAQHPTAGGAALDLSVASGETVLVGGARITLRDKKCAIYRLKRDPLAVAVLASALALVAGTSLTFFCPSERVP